MNDLNVRRFEMCVRVNGFLSANPLAFSKGSQGPQLVKQFAGAVTDIRRLSSAQVSGVAIAHAVTTTRVEARQALIDAMWKIERSARGMAVSIPGVDDKFRMPRKFSDTVLLNRAHAFSEAAVPLQDAFVRFEMPPKFIDDLNARIETLEEMIGNHAVSRGDHVAATGLLNGAIDQAMEILVQLDPIVENKLEDDSLLRMKWENARHTERAWTVSKTAPAAPATTAAAA